AIEENSRDSMSHCARGAVILQGTGGALYLPEGRAYIEGRSCPPRGAQQQEEDIEMMTRKAGCAGRLGGDRLCAVGGIALSLALGCTGAGAQDKYPSRPVRIVVSFAAGGPTDVVARIMGAKMGELLGQTFVVDNRPGAGGNTGADVVAKSPPDGYTLLMGTVSTHAINPGLYKRMPYDPVRDFVPAGQIGVTPTVLAVHPSVPARDVKSLIALLKANPGKYSYGSSGLGSILHLCGEQFKTLAGGLNVVHVP